MRAHPALTALLLSTAILLPAAWFLSAAHTPKLQQEEQPQTEVAPLVIPEEEKKRENPYKGNEENLALGKKLFSSQCKMCHGPEGKGDGDLAAEEGYEMPDFSDPAQQKKRTDGELHYILFQGHGKMPGQGRRLREEQMWGMVSYIRTLAAVSDKN